MKRMRSLAKEKGFSLIEAVIAMVILAGALILLSNSWGGAFKAIKKSKQQHEVALLLERKLTELDIEFRGKPLSEIPEEREDDFGEEFPDARWKIVSQELEFPDLSPLFKNQEQSGDQGVTEMLFKTLSENIKKSVKEVKLTVIIKEGKKKKEYSVVTYFVDFNQPLAM